MLAAYDLRVNDRAEPIDIPLQKRIRFSWKFRSDLNGEAATRLRLSLSLRDSDALIWTSEWADNTPTSRLYERPELTENSSYLWTLEYENATREIGSVTSTFETTHEDGLRWDSHWIRRQGQPWFDGTGVLVDSRAPTALARSWRTMYSQPPLHARKEFTVAGEVRRARLFASARGLYLSYLNSARVGRYELAPGWTEYGNRIEYEVYDVTELLTQGTNVWGVDVADGWWSGYVGYHTRKQAEQYGQRPEFIGSLRIEYENGNTAIINTDDTWRERTGHIVAADLLMGEFHDSAMETVGWLAPMPDTTGWREVEALPDDGRLFAPVSDPPTAVELLAPVNIWESEGKTLVDFGQNLAGHVRLEMDSQAPGDVITLRHGEMLTEGRLYAENLRSAEATDICVASGDREVFEPHFTLHGFRYVEITGWADPSPEKITALVVSSAGERSGTLETSSELVNQLVSNIWWSQRGNFISIPTDCPQRDERLGWTADAQIFCTTSTLNSNVKAFFENWLVDVRSSQQADGSIPDVIPLPPTSSNFSPAAPAWGDAMVIVPWQLYRAYGDREALRDCVPAMTRWIDYVTSQNPEGIWTHALGNNHGDWLSVNAATPKHVVSAAYRIHSVDLLANALDIVGDSGRAAEYRTLATVLRGRFASTYLTDDGTILGGTQTGQLLALGWDLVPHDARPSISERLVDDIRGRGNRLTTGFLGVQLLGPVLTEIGHGELAVSLLLQTEFPSWGYSIERGATTIWERWDGWTEEAGFQTPEMNSFNHYSLGSIGQWLYSSLAGIGQSPESAGYSQVQIKPVLTRQLDRVWASIESPRGRIAAGWRRDGEAFIVDIELPPGPPAQLFLPDSEHELVAGRHQFSYTDVNA